MKTAHDVLAQATAALVLAVDMREAQRDYFKTRSKEALIASKDRERAFDTAATEALRAAEPFMTGDGGTTA